MRILLINVTYNKGSTGTIVRELMKHYESSNNTVSVFYGRKSSIKKAHNIKKCSYEIESKICHFLSRFTGNLYGGMFFSTLKLKRMIRKNKPDLIHLHCLNGFFVNIYSLMKFLKKRNFKVLLTNHAEFMFTANCGYSLACNSWVSNECKKCKRIKEFNGNLSLNRTHYFFKKMQKSFAGFTNLKITAVSPWLRNRIKVSSIMSSYECESILNGVPDTLTFDTIDPYLDVKQKFGKEKIALFVCGNPENIEKGFKSFCDVAELLIDSNYLFVCIGCSPRKQCPKNIYFIDYVPNSQLGKYYHFADVTLLFSKCETFSLVCAESLWCGTPVIGYKSGGPESISLEKYSFFAEYGKNESIIKLLLSLPSFDKNQIAAEAHVKYDYASISNQYLNFAKCTN